MQPHITIMFKQPLENFSKVRNVVEKYKHLFYENQNPGYEEIGLVEIYPETSDPELNVESFKKAFDELKSGAVDYVALVANFAEDGENLTGPAEFHINLGDDTWNLKNDAKVPDFSLDQLIASGLTDVQALHVISYFSPKDFSDDFIP